MVNNRESAILSIDIFVSCRNAAEPDLDSGARKGRAGSIPVETTYNDYVRELA